MPKFFLFYVLFIISSGATAQLCTGSLGDPVVNISFGNGGTSGNSYVPAGSYSYTTSSCPDDGFYTITNSATGCFAGTWHNITADHTGGGAFMLVNASFQPADFFLTTVTGLCPGTSYEFSAWVMNVLKSFGIAPNITFSIETVTGTVINQFNTGSIPISAFPEWKQYGFYFTTSPGMTSVVLRMRNNAPGGQGNDLALDDISFRPCGPVVTAMITGNDNTIDVCEYDQETLSFTAEISPGFSLPVYFWQLSIDSGRNWNDIPGAAWLSYLRLPTLQGSYWYRMTVAESINGGIANCRIGSNVLKVNIRPRPIVDAGKDKFLIKGETVVLDATASGVNNSYEWLPPDYMNDNTLLHPEVAPISDITYTLNVVSPYGCAAEDDVNVKVVAGIFVPTAFTPNDDGKNDYWRIPFLDPQLDAEVKVFNRYGQIVYEVKAAYVNWDGKFREKPQPAGIYVYMIRFKGKSKLLRGTLALIR